MFEFFIFLLVLGIAYFAWRIVDQIPDVVFRLSEIQRDIAEIRRQMTADASAPSTAAASPSSGGDGDDG